MSTPATRTSRFALALLPPLAALLVGACSDPVAPRERATLRPNAAHLTVLDTVVRDTTGRGTTVPWW